MIDMQLPQLGYEYEIFQNVRAQKSVHYFIYYCITFYWIIYLFVETTRARKH